MDGLWSPQDPGCRPSTTQERHYAPKAYRKSYRRPYRGRHRVTPADMGRAEQYFERECPGQDTLS